MNLISKLLVKSRLLSAKRAEATEFTTRTPVAWQSLQITTIVSMRINQAKLCKTMQYHALPMSSETILDKKVLIVLLLKNSREFHFSISISRHFCFTFHFSKRVNQIWISLFTSQSK